MSRHEKSALYQAMLEGRSHTWTVSEGGSLASMRKAVKHGQTLTMSPILHTEEIQAGDMVLVRWHGGVIFHIVGEIQGDRYLIVNSLGKINGWVEASGILGRVTKIVEPEPRPDVQSMLGLLEAQYRRLIEGSQATEEDARRLLSIVDDLRWYAGRIGPEHWDELPRDDRWSFEQNLWKLARRARDAAPEGPEQLCSLIDEGKRCVGLASEALALFAGGGEPI